VRFAFLFRCLTDHPTSRWGHASLNLRALTSKIDELHRPSPIFIEGPNYPESGSEDTAERVFR
jgi:hypothetical protein